MPSDNTHVSVAILTGQSNPRRPRLSHSQQALLDAIDLPEASKVRSPFLFVPVGDDGDAPRHAGDADGDGVRTPLWLASLRNLRQFSLASTPRFARIARARWHAFLAERPALLLITGSCGLQLFNALHAANASSGQPASIRHVFALGPVAWCRPAVSHTLIQGEADGWSRLFFRDVDVTVPRLGHMGYFDDPTIPALINEHLCRHE